MSESPTPYAATPEAHTDGSRSRVRYTVEQVEAIARRVFDDGVGYGRIFGRQTREGEALTPDMESTLDKDFPACLRNALNQ